MSKARTVAPAKPKAQQGNGDEAKSRNLRIVTEDGKPLEKQLAELTTQGVVPMASVLTLYGQDTFSDPPSITDAYLELERLSAASAAGDLEHVERLLSAQMLALNAIFAGLAHRSKKNSQHGYMQAAETYLRLALKAQAQCRQTAEALFEMKNPRPVAFVQQANIAHGPQQVNNGPRAREENKTPPTELLEQKHGQWLDTGAQNQAGRADPHMAPVGAIHRAEDRGGQTGVGHESLPRRAATRAAKARARPSQGDAAAGGVAGEVGDA